MEFPERFNLAEWLLEENRRLRADHVCVRSATRECSYSQVDDETARLQSVLEEAGMRPEQRVLLVVPDVVEFVTTWLAVVRGGGVFAMVNPRLGAADFAYYLEYSRAAVAVVHDDAWAEFCAGAVDAQWLRSVIRVGGAAPPDPSGPRPPHGVATFDYTDALTHAPRSDPFDSHRDEICGWLFTSGTSGRPKAAMHFHQDFAWNIENYAKQVLALRADDVTMAVSKLFFGYATGTNLMFPFAVGGQTTLFAERSSPEVVVAHARNFRPTVLAAVPTTLAGILALDVAATAAAFDSLRMVLSAGEALPAELARRFRERFGVEILDGIGSAEMFHIYISNRPGEVRAGSVGRLVPGYEARIVDDAGRDLPDSQIGTLWVKGGSTALGYWLDREKSRATFHGDWTSTGDLFRREDGAWYYYEGRVDDLLKVGGIWVAPRQVEECLLEHAAVYECCVVGEDTADGLKVPVAIVVLAPDRSPSEELSAELQAHVKRRLAPYKFPRRIVYRDRLPRNDRGKIARKELERTVQREQP